jgi:hypothetical protein
MRYFRCDTPAAKQIESTRPSESGRGRRFDQGRLQFSVSITDNLKGLHAPRLPVGCAADSQSAIGYRIMVGSAGYRIAGTLARLSRCQP